jgi:hypothetical protein
LRSLWAGRPGAGDAEAVRRTVQVGGARAVQPIRGAARAAVGEFVSEMTGRGGTRAPTEQEIGA